MGEAKRRGTLEQRTQLAIERNEEAKKQTELNAIKAESIMTPKQKKKRHEGRVMFATCMAMASLHKSL